MSSRGLHALCLGWVCAVWFAGCQSTGVSGDAESHVPSFGIDRAPRQTEPEIETADTGDRMDTSSPDADESAEPENSRSKGHLLNRLLPGNDREAPQRKALPVSKRSEGDEGDNGEDGDDFEF